MMKTASNTDFKLSKRVHSHHTNPTNDIVVRFDASKITQDSWNILQNLSEIIKILQENLL